MADGISRHFKCLNVLKKEINRYGESVFLDSLISIEWCAVSMFC